MNTRMPTYGFLLSFLCILFVLRFLPSAPYPSTLYALLSAIFLGAGIVAVSQKRTTAWIIAAVVLGSIVALGAAERVRHVTSFTNVESFADNKNHELHGWIVEDPDVRPTETRMIVAVDTIDVMKKASGRVLITEYGGYPPHRYGDEVTVYGKLRLPEIFGSFDYPHYLELSGIRALISRGSVKPAKTNTEKPSEARTYAVFGYLYELRKSIEDRIGLILPEPHGSLLAGLLTGSRRGLPDHVSRDFRSSGITHIIAVSGYNITIILSLLSAALFWLPVKKRFWPLVLMVTGFTIFVGAGAPVVRAAIMGVLGLLALQTERVSTARLTIFWTAFFMLLWNPLQIWYDASFQLSFLAVFGITEFGPFLKKALKHVPETFAIRESLIATLAAQIGTLPVSILLFRQFSLISPVTNILVAPLVPLAMLTGTVSVLLSMLWKPLGLLSGYLTWAILELILMIAQVGALIPFASIRW